MKLFYCKCTIDNKLLTFHVAEKDKESAMKRLRMTAIKSGGWVGKFIVREIDEVDGYKIVLDNEGEI
ncbi:hypothetical protein Q7A53_05555 [Halobacillus rhizosphaerae]|uniref:hypothetical protein n=1 Tax=Halobacillus rhizosphaerae TaxID=3064889 RepID=UPI00398B7A9A